MAAKLDAREQQLLSSGDSAEAARRYALRVFNYAVASRTVDEAIAYVRDCLEEHNLYMTSEIESALRSNVAAQRAKDTATKKDAATNTNKPSMSGFTLPDLDGLADEDRLVVFKTLLSIARSINESILSRQRSIERLTREIEELSITSSISESISDLAQRAESIIVVLSMPLKNAALTSALRSELNSIYAEYDELRNAHLAAIERERSRAA